MLSLLTFLMFLFIAYAYFLYPLILMLLPKRSLFLSDGSPGLTVSIIVAARNEEAVIRNRLENLLEGDLPASTEILVCSDASDDRTDEIVREFEFRGVKLIRSPERRGKEFAQRLAVSEAKGDVIIFTDAKVRTEYSLVPKILRYFSDSSIGAVSSFDRVEGEAGSGEGMYVRYEMALRKLESQFQTLVGLSGSCFAVRREVASEIRENIPSDFTLLISAIRRGMRGVLAEDVVCSYGVVKSEEQEFSRKVRTVLRGISALFSMPEVMNWRKYGSFAWQILSHKLCRWLVPIFLILGTLGAYPLGESSWFWYLISLGLTAFYVLAAVGFFAPELRSKMWVKLPLFFCVTNAAVLVAWFKYLSGGRAVSWDPSTR